MTAAKKSPAGSARKTTPAKASTVVRAKKSVSAADAATRELLERIASAAERVVEILQFGDLPVLWDLDMISTWMEINPTTAKLHVLSRPDFPKPFRPTGKREGQKRWFRDEVIAFARAVRVSDDADGQGDAGDRAAGHKEK